MNKAKVYTDGACSGNPGPEGWANITKINGYTFTRADGEKLTTNNRMELTAVIDALDFLTEPTEIELFTDSSYIVNAINKGWLNIWANNNWKKSDNKPVKNQDLWGKSS